MKRFLSVLALALLGPLWRMPAWAQLTTLGVGGIAAVVVGTLITPTIVPQPGSYFNVNAANGTQNYALKPNNGTVGSFELPAAPVNSHVLYVEGIVSPVLLSSEYALGRGATIAASRYPRPLLLGSRHSSSRLIWAVRSPDRSGGTLSARIY
jgi:hypothetical protein